MSSVLGSRPESSIRAFVAFPCIDAIATVRGGDLAYEVRRG